MLFICLFKFISFPIENLIGGSMVQIVKIDFVE